MTIITRKVKHEYIATQMLRIADKNEVCAHYTHKDNWYIVTFECDNVEQWQLLNKELKAAL